MPKVKNILLLLILNSFFLLQGAGTEQLVLNTAESLANFFKTKYDAAVAVVRFENHAGISDLAAQKFYQLLASKLESEKNIQFIDLMINFQEGKGVFNLKRTSSSNYLIYLKLSRNRTRVGAGVVVFSKLLDKVVLIKYFEQEIPAGEIDLLNTRNFGFKGAGFQKLFEMDCPENLMDICTFTNTNKELRYYFYYPTAIYGYGVTDNRLVKLYTLNLEWGRPFYPVQEFQGKLLLFSLQGKIFMTAGNNFSSHSKVFAFEQNWQEVDRINFTPFAFFKLNQVFYLAGGRFSKGKNYLLPRIVMVPFSSGKVSEKEHYEKSVPEFYTLAFSLRNMVLQSVHLIDREYNMLLFNSNFEPVASETVKKGSSLAIKQSTWLAVSDHLLHKDKLNFYKISSGGHTLTYENHLPEGEVVFISDGIWQDRPGFWVYLKTELSSNIHLKLQFWGKNIE